MKVTLLTGGVGGSKLALGFYKTNCVLTAIVNTGDDIVIHGLHVSPDPDILIYTLAGVVNETNGWGFREETFNVAIGLALYGRETWFQLGDRDLATHIHRTAMLASGLTLSQAIESIRMSLGVAARILPMSDEPAPTILHTDDGEMHLQEYLVRRRCEPVVREVQLRAAAQPKPAPGVIEAIEEADIVVVAPSNPLISIGPILAVTGVRDALRRRRERVVSVCPLVGGKSLKGPTDKMLTQLGYEATPATIAALYSDFCGAMIVDLADDGAHEAIQVTGVQPILMPAVMVTLSDKQRLANGIMAQFR